MQRISLVILIFNTLLFCLDGGKDGSINISYETEFAFLVLDTIEFAYNKKDKKNVKAANKLYDRLAYQKAIVLYTKIGNLGINEKRNLANAYRLVNDTENAEKWYREVAASSTDPVIFFQLAQLLQTNGKDEEAAIYFDRYAQQTLNEPEWDKTSKYRASNIRKSNRFNNANVQLKNEALINSSGIEYSPAFFKDNIIFVSTRGVQSYDRKPKDTWIDENYMSLYKAKIDDQNNLIDAVEFSYDLNTDYHEGPVCFFNHGEIIYFTRNNFQNGERVNDTKGVMKLEIFSSQWDGENWIETKSLNFNLIDSDECHPSISSDGMKLYFSSNRPGGYGGMDLYVTENRYGNWTNPKNLGPTINTPGNEVFPFIHENGQLFFASNGWDGLGGLDVFFASKSGQHDWSNSINLGKPFNTKQDDFGIILDPKGNFGYLSSNRKGGMGKDDIYSFELEKSTNKLSPMEILTRKASEGNEWGNIVSIYSFPIQTITYHPELPQINISKLNSSLPAETPKKGIIHTLNSGKSFVLENLYYAFNRHEILPQARQDLDHLITVMKANPEMVIELGSHTDSRGSSEYNKKLSIKRANAAVQYIIARGISKNNIRAQGYGEDKIRNHCTEGKKCSDVEHQFNRRTEIRVLNHSEIKEQR